MEQNIEKKIETNEVKNNNENFIEEWKQYNKEVEEKIESEKGIYIMEATYLMKQFGSAINNGYLDSFYPKDYERTKIAVQHTIEKYHKGPGRLEKLRFASKKAPEKFIEWLGEEQFSFLNTIFELMISYGYDILDYEIINESVFKEIDSVDEVYEVIKEFVFNPQGSKLNKYWIKRGYYAEFFESTFNEPFKPTRVIKINYPNYSCDDERYIKIIQLMRKFLSDNRKWFDKNKNENEFRTKLEELERKYTDGKEEMYDGVRDCDLLSKYYDRVVFEKNYSHLPPFTVEELYKMIETFVCNPRESDVEDWLKTGYIEIRRKWLKVNYPKYSSDKEKSAKIIDLMKGCLNNQNKRMKEFNPEWFNKNENEFKCKIEELEKEYSKL